MSNEQRLLEELQRVVIDEVASGRERTQDALLDKTVPTTAPTVTPVNIDAEFDQATPVRVDEVRELPPPAEPTEPTKSETKNETKSETKDNRALAEDANSAITLLCDALLVEIRDSIKKLQTTERAVMNKKSEAHRANFDLVASTRVMTNAVKTVSNSVDDVLSKFDGYIQAMNK